MNLNYLTRFFMLIFLVFVIGISLATNATAQEWKRYNKSEYYGLIQNMGGDKTDSSAYGTKFTMDIGSTSAIGLGYGMNYSNELNLNMDVWFGSTDITGKGMGVTVNMDTSLTGLDLNLDYNILQSRFTPVVSGGFGFITFSGGEVGYEFKETDLSYNYGGGIRWDVSDHFLIKTIYRITSTTLEETEKAILLKGVNISIGYIF